MNEYQPQEQLQNATLILILGILSIIGCFCYGVLGIILAIVALILAQKATKTYAQNPEMYLGYQNVKIGKILAIIGLVISVIYMCLVIWLIVTFGMEALQDQELMQQRLEEMMGQ
ncbi:CCC motif membrane protein [uncultured Psychroserpens sp.]|uniref:CCC motif membrane protein n=1 Tax=uncultured Psychroserpens sp. TaxID=255436 RepID=UPI0026186247|nr:CCC motif membrane protein [uncultured Psychroserpens sp.]